MKLILLALVITIFSSPSWAEESASSMSLPEPLCDITTGSDGIWLEGDWVGPYAQFSFSRTVQGQLKFIYHQKRGVIIRKKQESAFFDGNIQQISPCSFSGRAGEGDILLEAVSTEDGQIQVIMTSPKEPSEDRTRQYSLRRKR